MLKYNILLVGLLNLYLKKFIIDGFNLFISIEFFLRFIVMLGEMDILR